MNRQRGIRPDNPVYGHVDEVCEMYRAGQSAPEIGSHFGVSYATIYRALSLANCPTRSTSEAKRNRSVKRHRELSLDESAFDVVNEESAYFAGLLMADGCVHVRKVGQPCISLVVTAGDRLIVERFRVFMRSGHRLTVEEKGGFANRKATVRLAFVSQAVADALARYGVVPRKTTEARVEILGNNRHFWRGMVDGDGSVGWFNQKGNRLPFVSLCGTESVVQQFHEYVTSIVSTKASIHPAGSIYSMHVAGRAAHAVATNLYNNATVSIPRKFETAKAVMAWEPKLNSWADLSPAAIEEAYKRLGQWKLVAVELGIAVGVLKAVRRRLKVGYYSSKCPSQAI